jgi:hypothetical protein
MNNTIRSNFDMLRAYEAQLWRMGALAERYFAEDPNTSLLKLRQFSFKTRSGGFLKIISKFSEGLTPTPYAQNSRDVKSSSATSRSVNLLIYYQLQLVDKATNRLIV